MAGPRRPLRRSRQDKVLAGVCGGLGRYLGIDPVILRVLMVVLIFAGVGRAGLAAAGTWRGSTALEHRGTASGVDHQRRDRQLERDHVSKGG